MPQFIVFAIAASMCVLCFAVGFIAALVLRIAQHTAASDVAGSGRVDQSVSQEAEPLQPRVVDTQPSAVPEARSISLPEVESAESPWDAAARPATTSPAQHATHLVRSGGFPGPPAPPPAKVYLFGEPHLEAVVVPSLASVHAGSPASTAVSKPHVAPPRLAPAEIDLLPRRPQHARTARRR